MSLANERERYATDQAERSSGLERREEQVKTLEADLRMRRQERAALQTELSKVEAKIRAAEKRAVQAEARAQRLQHMPPEKGGGPNAAANARVERDEAHNEALGLTPDRDVARQKAESLDAPLADLVDRGEAARGKLRNERQGLAEAQAAHQRAVSVMQTEKGKVEADRDQAARELTQRFVTVGTLLNLNRVDAAAFQPLYLRIDDLKASINTREALLERLDTERESFDRTAVQRGLITLGITFAGLVLLTILLVALASR